MAAPFAGLCKGDRPLRDRARLFLDRFKLWESQGNARSVQDLNAGIPAVCVWLADQAYVSAANPVSHVLLSSVKSLCVLLDCRQSGSPKQKALRKGSCSPRRGCVHDVRRPWRRRAQNQTPRLRSARQNPRRSVRRRRP